MEQKEHRNCGFVLTSPGQALLIGMGLGLLSCFIWFIMSICGHHFGHEAYPGQVLSLGVLIGTPTLLMLLIEFIITKRLDLDEILVGSMFMTLAIWLIISDSPLIISAFS